MEKKAQKKFKTTAKERPRILNNTTAVLSMAVMLFTCQATTNLHPLILVPGSGGNQLEARLTDEYKPSSLFCNRWLTYHVKKKSKDGWFRIWFDLSDVILAPFTKCFADRMTLYYDPVLDDYYNAPGVETRVPDFGSTQSLLYLDPNLKQVTSYMANLVSLLEKLGYVDGENLFGAPYDFRYGLAAKGHPSKVGSKFLDDLKHLIENASNSNGGKPVIILSHSLGGLFVQKFLNRNSVSWRKKHVKHFIALSTPWGGTVEQMLVFASGYTLGIPLANPLLVREEQRSSESNLWLLPYPKVFADNTLVVFKNNYYTARDIPRFLEDIGAPEWVYPYESRILPMLLSDDYDRDLGGDDGVPVTCLIGSGVRTAEKLIYGENSDDGFDKQPEIEYGDGDGTVNMVSLVALASAANRTVKLIKIPGVSHTNILKDVVALDRIIGEIRTINSVTEFSFFNKQ